MLQSGCLLDSVSVLGVFVPSEGFRGQDASGVVAGRVHRSRFEELVELGIDASLRGLADRLREPCRSATAKAAQR